MYLILTALVGAVGAYSGLRLRVPAGALVGSMMAVMLFNVAFDMAYMPPGLKFFTQAATGAYVGAKITAADAKNLRRIIRPALILSGVMLLFTTGTALIICRISDLTIPTALFSMAPGGIADMTLASMDMPQSQPSVVALIQTLRVVFSILLLPPIIRRFAREQAPLSQPQAAPSSHKSAGSLSALALTLLVALLFGSLGKVLGVPGGAIAFSTIGCAAYNMKTGRGYMPLRLRQFIQIFAGALIGAAVGRQQALQLLELWDVALLAIVSFILLDLIAGTIIARCTKMDLTTALFACAPGGLTDMNLIAAELGANGVEVAGMHMVRLVSVVALYPAVIHLLTPILSAA